MQAQVNAPKERRDYQKHYRAIVAEAARLGWPKKFRTDLTKHDRAFLADRDPSKPFAWVLREDGTHLAAPGVIDGVRHKASQYATMVAEAFRPHPCRFYLWDGAYLVECATAAELDTRMLEIETELGL